MKEPWSENEKEEKMKRQRNILAVLSVALAIVSVITFSRNVGTDDKKESYDTGWSEGYTTGYSAGKLKGVQEEREAIEEGYSENQNEGFSVTDYIQWKDEYRNGKTTLS